MTDVFISFNVAGTWKDAETDSSPEEMQDELERLIKKEFKFDEMEWCHVEVSHD